MSRTKKYVYSHNYMAIHDGGGNPTDRSAGVNKENSKINEEPCSKVIEKLMIYYSLANPDLR